VKLSNCEGCLATINGEGYRVPIGDNRYYWGSNSDVLNNAKHPALADFPKTNVSEWRKQHGLHIGTQCTGFSFVSGYGTSAMQHPITGSGATNPQMVSAAAAGAIAGSQMPAADPDALTQ
jgi:hypothetical protein